MFDLFLGIPAHPLIVHAAVVFIPLQAAAAIVYGFVPVWRRFMAWAVLGLAVIAPLSAWAAKFSGEAFEQRLLKKGVGGETINMVNQHASFAAVTAWLTLGLSVVMILQLLVGMRSRRLATAPGETAEITRDAADVMGSPVSSKLVSLVLAVVALGLGGVTIYYVARTGDLGAHIAWSGYGD